MKQFASVVALCAVLPSSAVLADAVIRSAAGRGQVQAAVDLFRADLGGVNNGAGGGPFDSGRREINWDAAGLDAFQSPGFMPPDFFNNNSKRGAVFTTPDGRGVKVSVRNAADPDDPRRLFGDIEPEYVNQFQAFTPLRIFGVDGGVQTDGRFFVPNDPAKPATINGFGVVFTDVDFELTTKLELFDAGGHLLHREYAPVAAGDLSFVGVSFNAGERVFSVRITTGNAGLGALDSIEKDVVAMDDFIYAEPQLVPAPGLLALSAAGLLVPRRRRAV